MTTSRRCRCFYKLPGSAFDFFTVIDYYTRWGREEVKVPFCRKQINAQFFSIRAAVLLSKAFKDDFLHLSLGSYTTKASKAVAEVS